MKLYRIKSRMPWLFCFLLSIVSCVIQAQSNGHKPLTFYDTYPWQGQKGYNFGLTYYGRPGLDAGILVSDLPKRNSVQYRQIRDGWIFANQNIFFNTELTADHDQELVAGPKLGYEFNLAFFSGRLSDVCYIKPGIGTFDNRVLAEAGVTLFGFGSLCYGYSQPTQRQAFDNINRHRLTLRINVFPAL